MRSVCVAILLAGLVLDTHAQTTTGQLGANSCPQPTRKIDSEVECKNAATSYTNGACAYQYKNGLSKANWPSGCMAVNIPGGVCGHVYFNRHSTGAGNGHVEPLCRYPLTSTTASSTTVTQTSTSATGTTTTVSTTTGTETSTSVTATSTTASTTTTKGASKIGANGVVPPPEPTTALAVEPDGAGDGKSGSVGEGKGEGAADTVTADGSTTAHRSTGLIVGVAVGIVCLLAGVGAFIFLRTKTSNNTDEVARRVARANAGEAPNHAYGEIRVTDPRAGVSKYNNPAYTPNQAYGGVQVTGPQTNNPAYAANHSFDDHTYDDVADANSSAVGAANTRNESDVYEESSARQSQLYGNGEVNGASGICVQETSNGRCTNEAAEGLKRCIAHTCSLPGCTAKKSSKKELCNTHTNHSAHSGSDA